MRRRWGTDTCHMYKEWINLWPLQWKRGTLTSHSIQINYINYIQSYETFALLGQTFLGLMDGRTNGQTKSHMDVSFPFKYVRPKICPSQNMFVQKYIHLKKLFDSKMSAQDLICHKILGCTRFETDNERMDGQSHIFTNYSFWALMF